ncbi:MAG: LLM class flavin-dependent oxidoreductase [Acidimicrobiales bacterium]
MANALATANTHMAETGLAAGVHIVPLMPAADVIAIAIEAERLGYDYCLIADEGFHPDVYVSLGAIARETSHIKLGVMTNPYTRHPAATANALATVDALAPGRVVGTLLAGGSMVLAPMGIDRIRPFRRMTDAVQIARTLWTGQLASVDGQTASVVDARLGSGAADVELWIAGRGPLVLGLAGREADGVIFTVKPDLAGAIAEVERAVPAGRPHPKRMYLGRICYTPAMLEAQKLTLSYVLMDSPERALDALGFDADQVAVIVEAAQTGNAAAVDPLVTDDLLHRYQVAGTPAQCAAEVAAMAAQHDLHAIHIDALSADLDENLSIIENSLPIIKGTPK